MIRFTPGPWCWEQCGDKEDAPVVGTAYLYSDTDCKNPLSGCLRDYDENGNELEYYRETIAFEIQSCDGCSASANAALIAAAPELYAALEAVDRIVLEQRCERGTPWDIACVTIAAKVREYAAPILAKARGEGQRAALPAIADGTATAALCEDIAVPQDCQARAVRHRPDSPSLQTPQGGDS